MKHCEGHLEPEVAELHVKKPRAACMRIAVGEKQVFSNNFIHLWREIPNSGQERGWPQTISCNELPCHSHEQPKTRAADNSPAQACSCPPLQAPSVLLSASRCSIWNQECSSGRQGIFLLARVSTVSVQISCQNFKQRLQIKLTRQSVEVYQIGCCIGFDFKNVIIDNSNSSNNEKLSEKARESVRTRERERERDDPYMKNNKVCKLEFWLRCGLQLLKHISPLFLIWREN